MKEEELITPEYIMPQLGSCSNEELLALIENHGDQEYERGSEAASWGYH